MSSTLSSLPPGITNTNQCTKETCPVILATIPYVPSLIGNIIFMGIWGLAALSHLGLGIKYKTWTFMGAMVAGCALEVLGYLGRVQLNSNPFNEDAFLMYLICATIAPVFITGGIYLCLSRVIIIFGESLSYLRPRTYTILFVTCDVISLILQAAGGALVSISDDKATSDIGLRIMQAGLIFQVASLVVFVALCSFFFWRVRQCVNKGDVNVQLNTNFLELRKTRRFRGFLVGFSIATIAMITRCGYRVAELAEGFNGPIWANEKEFMVLEGAVLAVCILLITGFHPGWCMKGRFREASFAMKELRKRGKGGPGFESYDSSVSGAPVGGGVEGDA
ncbi:RTA1 like domain containing protein [Rhypophila decipiens]